MKKTWLTILVLVLAVSAYAEDYYKYHPAIDQRLKQFDSQVEKIIEEANRKIDRLETQAVQDMNRVRDSLTREGRLHDAVEVEKEVRRLAVDGVTVGIVTNVGTVPPVKECEPIVGEWDWCGIGALIVDAGGNYLFKDKRGGEYSGKWISAKGELSYTFNWDSGDVDSVSVSMSRKRIDGKSSKGHAVYGIRIK